MSEVWEVVMLVWRTFVVLCVISGLGYLAHLAAKAIGFQIGGDDDPHA